MGIKSLKANDALIRCKTGEIWFLGSGGVKIEASPGSRHFQMREALSGHWMLPINRFSDKREAKRSGMVLSTESTQWEDASSSKVHIEDRSEQQQSLATSSDSPSLHGGANHE